MTGHPRIQLDASRLLGFKQVKGVRPGRFAGQQAETGPVAETPEPSTWAQLLLGLLVLGFFAWRGRYQKKKAQAAAIADSSAGAVAAGAAPLKE